MPWRPIPKQPCFVCVGRLYEQKGQFLFIEAVSRLGARGENFKVVLVRSGDLRNPIEEALKCYQLEDIVEITCWATQAQVQQYIFAS